jgi:4a-hydroxytetrahydrobiopterin dehydratase
MARPVALEPERIDEALRSMDDWVVEAGKLHARFAFGDFSTAFGFMSAAAVVAAEMDHHPEWSNVYSKVTVDLVTHDAGGITELDLRLARRMSALAAALAPDG